MLLNLNFPPHEMEFSNTGLETLFKDMSIKFIKNGVGTLPSTSTTFIECCR